MCGEMGGHKLKGGRFNESQWVLEARRGELIAIRGRIQTTTSSGDAFPVPVPSGLSSPYHSHWEPLGTLVTLLCSNRRSTKRSTPQSMECSMLFTLVGSKYRL